ncbi:hypothetical protein [Alkalibaculum bacchi]|nr:hypothetical protein [Alkalibaculum bacchi]
MKKNIMQGLFDDFDNQNENNNISSKKDQAVVKGKNEIKKEQKTLKLSTHSIEQLLNLVIYYRNQGEKLNQSEIVDLAINNLYEKEIGKEDN